MGDTALTLCAAFGDEKTMQYLISDPELDIKQTGKTGRNLFHSAVMNKDSAHKMLHVVNKKDKDLKFQQDDDGDTVVIYI